MSDSMEFIVGAVVACDDGECGQLLRMIVDSSKRSVTHVVVEAKHRKGSGRLVPVDLVASTSPDEVVLHCDLAAFDSLDHAEVEDVRSELRVDLELQAAAAGGGGGWRFGLGSRGGPAVLDPDGLGSPDVDGSRTGLVPEPVTFEEDNIPGTEGEVSSRQPVHASDGPVGHVRGLLTDGAHRVSQILLDEGHLWGEKEVAIPIGAVKFVVDDGVYLDLTKKQVGDLPPADHAGAG